jgi:hypothetical protein
MAHDDDDSEDLYDDEFDFVDDEEDDDASDLDASDLDDEEDGDDADSDVDSELESVKSEPDSELDAEPAPPRAPAPAPSRHQRPAARANHRAPDPRDIDSRGTDDREFGSADRDGDRDGERDRARDDDRDPRAAADDAPSDVVVEPALPANYRVHIYEFREFKRTIDRPFTAEDAESFASEYNRTSKSYGRFAVTGKDDASPKKALD